MSKMSCHSAFFVASILLLATLGPVGSARSQHLAVGVTGGYGSFTVAGESEREGVPLIGAYADVDLIPFMGLEGSVEYGWKSGVGDSVEHTFSHLAVYATGRYRMALPLLPLTPYTGFGGGWHRQKWGEEEDDFGIHFLGGVDFALPGALVGVVGRYVVIFGEEETRRAYVVAGRLAYPLSLM
jgi:hypothetical protein